MSRFYAVVPFGADAAHKSPLLREVESFMANHGTCMVCRRRPSRFVASRGGRRVAVCGPCDQFDAPAAPTRRDDPAAARARAERARAMLAVVSRM